MHFYSELKAKISMLEVCQARKHAKLTIEKANELVESAIHAADLF